MVAGEDTQAARINRHAVEQAVLHREVRHQHVGRRISGGGEVGVERLARPAIDGHVARIGRGAREGCLRHAAKHQNRIIIAGFPGGRVQAAERGPHRMVPGPHQVEPQFRQALKGRRQRGPDQEFL